jgi:hypothetical protein
MKNYDLIFENGSLGTFAIDEEDALDTAIPMACRIDKLGKFIKIIELPTPPTMGIKEKTP